MELTANQKAFLLEYFFKNDQYPGWFGIAQKLVTNGSVIVAGTECIWKGGIGNFIKTSEAEDLVDCLKYEFDVKEFMSSLWFKEIKANKVTQLSAELDEVQREFNDILNLA